MISEVTAHGLGAVRGGRRLFQDLDFTLRSGEALAVQGANGAGKSTLLRLIAGLTAPAEGEIRFEGPAGPRDPEDVRTQDLHLVGHRDGLKTSQTADEELRFWSAWAGRGGAPDTACERLGLSAFLRLPVAVLSAGQRRRLALARLLAAPRRLWLLDEPLAPLDAASRAVFAALMAEHLDAGGLIVAATHDPLPIRSARIEIGTA